MSNTKRPWHEQLQSRLGIANKYGDITEKVLYIYIYHAGPYDILYIPIGIRRGPFVCPCIDYVHNMSNMHSAYNMFST